MRKLLVLASSAILGSLMLAMTASSPSAAPGAAKPRTLVTRNPVWALAADGDRVALLVWSRSRDWTAHPRGRCGVIVWEPIRRRVVRFQRPCAYEANNYASTVDVALAGTRVAWLSVAGGMTRDTIVMTATLARPKPVDVGYGASNPDSGHGDFARRPVGDGTLLAFTIDRRCDDPEGSYSPCPPGRKPGDIVAATVWRVAGRGRCPSFYSLVRRCSRVATADGELSVLAVDAGRIAVRTDSGLRLLTAGGAVLREFDVTARAAALSGNRLAVRVAGAIEVYDTGSGELTARFPAARHLRLEDLDRDILVTASGRTVSLRRLSSGRTTTIHAAGIASAQLERPGLFVSGGRRVTFTPMHDVLRMLGGKHL